jgi:hypothetical protein
LEINQGLLLFKGSGLSRRNEISPRQATDYDVFRILLTFIPASCGELNPGEIK